MNEEYLLTTIDNPFSPFTDWDKWLAFDESKGYDCSGYLARIAIVSDNLSPDEYQNAVNDAIQEIITINPLGLFKKAKRNDYT